MTKNYNIITKLTTKIAIPVNNNIKIAKYTNLSAPIKQLHLHTLNSHEHKYTSNFEEILG